MRWGPVICGWPCAFEATCSKRLWPTGHLPKSVLWTENWHRLCCLKQGDLWIHEEKDSTDQSPLSGRIFLYGLGSWHQKLRPGLKDCQVSPSTLLDMAQAQAKASYDHIYHMVTSSFRPWRSQGLMFWDPTGHRQVPPQPNNVGLQAAMHGKSMAFVGPLLPQFETPGNTSGIWGLGRSGRLHRKGSRVVDEESHFLRPVVVVVVVA